MRLNNQELLQFLSEKEIQVLYHANTVRTSLTFFQQNGLLSRGAVEYLGLEQTVQDSDKVDKLLNVWHDVFLDTTDLHTFFRRQNHYGPVLFEFDTVLLNNPEYEVWITKNNPIYWSVDSTIEEKYFQGIDELRSEWDNYSRQRKMITIRNNTSPILFEYLRRVIVDDPRLDINNVDGSVTHVFNETVNLIKSNIPDGHILSGKFKSRECTNCWCRNNYLKEVHVNDIRRLFL